METKMTPHNAPQAGDQVLDCPHRSAATAHWYKLPKSIRIENNPSEEPTFSLTGPFVVLCEACNRVLISEGGEHGTPQFYDVVCSLVSGVFIFDGERLEWLDDQTRTHTPDPKSVLELFAQLTPPKGEYDQ